VSTDGAIEGSMDGAAELSGEVIGARLSVELLEPLDPQAATAIVATRAKMASNDFMGVLLRTLGVRPQRARGPLSLASQRPVHGVAGGYHLAPSDQPRGIRNACSLIA
jgi:hypothetical protein